MPIRPPPRHFSCPACQWSKTVSPASDTLMRGHDHFDACPKCGHAPLRQKALPAVPASMAQIGTALEKFFKP